MEILEELQPAIQSCLDDDVTEAAARVHKLQEAGWRLVFQTYVWPTERAPDVLPGYVEALDIQLRRRADRQWAGEVAIGPCMVAPVAPPALPQFGVGIWVPEACYTGEQYGNA